MTEQNTAPQAAGDTAVPAQATAPEAAPQETPQDAVPEQQAAEPSAAAPFAAPEALPAAPRDRRKMFAALRWTAAVLVFGAVGTGAAYQVTQPERTDIPGLSTKADGRWTYPALAKPTLPAGAPVPFAADNKDGIHYAGLTQLLLPAPVGSTPDSTLKREKDEAVAPDAFLAEYEDSERAAMKEQFANEGLRQIVGRGWTTPDGTRTRVYLLRYHGLDFADTFKGCSANMRLKGVAGTKADPSWGKVKLRQAVPAAHEVALYEETAPVGDEQVKIGCLRSGDVVGVILQTRKGEVAAIPFHQTVILQSQLLG